MRVCCKCKKEKSLKEFAKHKRMKDGRDTICRECARERAREHYKNNKEKRISLAKKYYEEHRENMLEKAAKYREENREIINEYFREYQKTQHRKDCKRIYNSKRRSKCEETDITTEYVLKLKEETNFCPICGIKLSDEGDNNKYHLDHIIPLAKNGLHMKSNIRFICRKCNLEKGSK
jgi:hypothetical protein